MSACRPLILQDYKTVRPPDLHNMSTKISASYTRYLLLLCHKFGMTMRCKEVITHLLSISQFVYPRSIFHIYTLVEFYCLTDLTHGNSNSKCKL